MLREVIDCTHAITDAQRMPADIISTDAEGHIIDDDGNNIAPPPLPDDIHRRVDPAGGVYMGLHKPPPDPAPVNDGNNHPPPEFHLQPAEAALPDDNYFLPLADADEDGVVGTAD
mmetsp:Transcript_17391/g.36467  ORF Transcript_17391/g.36467 Transcript_17391/m.36467 type:complete len:115 (+) Transcript_17391:2674-3018(+)